MPAGSAMSAAGKGRERGPGDLRADVRASVLIDGAII